MKKIKQYMNKHFFKLICACLLLSSICSCWEENGELQNSDHVFVSFTYTLDTSNGNSMSRASTIDSNVFDVFYEKMKTGELVATSYSLTLTNVNTGEVHTIKGKWNGNNFASLKVGSYRLVGMSTAEGKSIQSKCSLTFDEQIEVSIENNSIVLHANYDSFLLIFNDKNIKLLENYDGTESSPFFTFKDYKYAFVNKYLFNEDKKEEACIFGQHINEDEFRIFTGHLEFKKGKYYTYNSVTHNFEIPPMDSGIEDEDNEIEGFGCIAEAIDLGLSVKWASWNIGASKIADYGGLYGAGDPTGLQTSTYSSLYYYNDGESICGTNI